MRLNEKTVRAITPPLKGYRLVRDDGLTGFAVRVTAKGAKSFTLNYTIDGRERRLTIGKWPAWTTTAARQRAKELRQQADRGIDPLEQRQHRREAPTFAELAEEYMARHGDSKKSAAAMAGMLGRDVLPVIGRRKAEDLKRRDIIALVEAKVRQTPIAGNRVLQLVRGIFNWGIGVDLVEYNPCHKVKAPAEENGRDRVLSAAEIRTVWNALPTASLTPTTAALLRLVLTTGQRPGECCAAEWDEIDGHWWTIPASKTKNDLAHRVPLSGLALEIIDGQRNDTALVFPSRYSSLKPASKAGLSTAVQLNECFGVPHWTPRDLRRTAASHMASIGVQRFIIGRVLNHSEPGITKVYDRHSYDAEKRAALAKWERHLRSIIGQGERAEVVEIGS